MALAPAFGFARTATFPALVALLAAFRSFFSFSAFSTSFGFAFNVEANFFNSIFPPPAASAFLASTFFCASSTISGFSAIVLRSQGKTVLLCAADTFRAAAIEQLEVWAQRTGVEMIRQQTGADPSAVVFDALQSAKARKVDCVIVDTAGRLHTKTNLMAELEKMRRTAARVIPGAPHEVLLVIEATTGQNGLEQARKFTESAEVSGIILTKLDGTAKGGVVVAISRELNLPIRYVGVGEKIDDLLLFDPETFVASLFD